MSVDYAWPSYLKQTQLLCVTCAVCEQPAVVCHGPQLPCVRYSLRVSLTPTLRGLGDYPSPTIDPRMFSPCEIFKHAHLKIMVYGSKQASKHTHACAQCSHASVGLAQARSNESLLHYAVHGVTYVCKLMTEFKKLIWWCLHGC